MKCADTAIAATTALAALLTAWSAAMAQPVATANRDMARISGPTPAFFIDRHEVTVGQFRAFVSATGTMTKAEKDGGGFQFLGGWQRMKGWVWSAPYGKPARDDEPAAHVTWHEAKAYCTWAGLRLPTDAEWVRAAYTETRAPAPKPFKPGKSYDYPSGDSPDGANQIATMRKLTGFVAAVKDIGQGRGHLPVKTTAPGVNGLWDMGGNLWEWVDHDVGGQKRTRGGSWWYGPDQMRADALYEKAADFPAVYIGFRCARDA